MFFLLSQEKNILLHPRDFGAHWRKELVKQLHATVEGTCSPKYGFIVSVTKIESIGDGRVQEGTGKVVFPVSFQAVVFRPFKNEVVDAVVDQVAQHGFSAQVGPLRLFVSRHNIPEDMTFDPQTSQFVTDDQSMRIGSEDEVRVRIIGLRYDPQRIVGIGSIYDDYLGLLRNSDA